MDNNKKATLELGTKPVGSLLVQYALPAIIAMTASSLYNIIDRMFIGQVVGPMAISGLAITFPFMNLSGAFGAAVGVGASTAISVKLGQKDYATAENILGNTVTLNLIIGLVLGFTCLVFLDPILRFFGASDQTLPYARDFMQIILLGNVFTHMYFGMNAVLRAASKPRHAMYATMFTVVCNILLDVVLILGFRMGVEGAEIATFLSQAFASWLCRRFIQRRMTMLVPRGDERAFDNKKISILLNNGVPMGLQFSITAVGIIMLQSANNALGTLYVASFTAAIRIKYLFTCILENIGVAMATYCGQNIGAGKIGRVKTGVRDAMGMMMVYFVLTVALIYPSADEMMALFVNADEHVVIVHAAQLMRIANWFYPALGVLVILRYSIQGLGYSNLSLMSGVMEMIARCGVSLWMVPALAWLGVCYADPVAWCMADVFLIPAFFWLLRRLRRHLPKQV